MKKHFVFDLDDTLTDAYKFNQQMFVDTFAPYLDLKIPETEAFLRDLHYNSRGTSMVDQFTEVIKHFSLKLDPKKLFDENEQLHIKNVDRVQIFDAVEEVIKNLKEKGREISLCTNRQQKSCMKILENHNLVQYFTNIVSCSDAGHEKPDPYCLNEIIAKSGLDKDEFIYFGDSKTDYLFASSAGIDFIIIDHYLNEKKFYKMIVRSFL